MKKRYYIIIFIILFIMFLLLYLLNKINTIDNLMYNLIISIKSNNVTNFMKFITFFASTYFILFVIIISFILGISKKNNIFNILNIVMIGEIIINSILKIIVKRERPLYINLVEENTYSFPSGHTMIAVTLYGFIIYLLIKSNINKKYKIISIISLIILILLILISRIYLGAHYFSDVSAGLFLALAHLLVCIGIIERKKII